MRANSLLRESFHNSSFRAFSSSSFPKRPPTSAFAFFVQAHKSAGGQNFKENGEKWKNLSEEEKKPYLDLLTQAKERYAAHMASLTPEQRGEMENTKRSQKLIKTLAPRASKLNIHGSNLFFKENYLELKQQNPEIDQKSLLSLIAKKWGDLPEEQKQDYSSRAQHIREERKAQLEKKLIQIAEDKKIASYRPPTSFFIYVSEHKNRLVSELEHEQPGLSKKELMLLSTKKAAQEWTQLTEEQKQPYVEKWQKLKEEHANDPKVQEAKSRLEQEELEEEKKPKKRGSKKRKSEELDEEDEEEQ